MSDENFLLEYEKLLNKGYCNCNEMNCIDNNSPRRILNIAKTLQKENEDLKKQLKELEEQSANSINKQMARGIGLVNQQKQFIEYLEEPIKIITDGNPTNISEYTAGKLDALKEILSKYKEIIGGKE